MGRSMIDRLFKSALIVGFWGMLLPWGWAKFVADQILYAEDLNQLAEWAKSIMWLHAATLALILPVLMRLHELRQMPELDRSVRDMWDNVVNKLSRRLYGFMFVVILSGVVCLSIPIFKANKMLYLAMLFFAGNTAYFSAAILISLCALLLKSLQMKTRIQDDYRDKKERQTLLDEMKKDREKGFDPVESLDRYNQIIERSCY